MSEFRPPKETNQKRLQAGELLKTRNDGNRERAVRLARMRSRTSRNSADNDHHRPLHTSHDVEKLIRTRLTPEEALALRTAFSMFESKKYPGTIKTSKLWTVFRALGLAPTPSEYDSLLAQMDKNSKGHIKQINFMREMERYYTQYFSKSSDIEKAFSCLCGLTDDDADAVFSTPANVVDLNGAITADELTKAMMNLGFEMPEDLEERDNDILDMIEEVDSKGMKEIDLDDFVKMLTTTTDDIL